MIPIANITVSFGTNVTSRLLTYSSISPTLFNTNTSEALLMIDEPGSGLAQYYNAGQSATTGWGPLASQVLCGTGGAPYSLVGAGSGGCTEYVQQLGNQDWVAANVTTGFTGATNQVGANMFSGVVNSNQVTFFGIPIMPPASAGAARIFRMSNIRVNANGLGGGGLAGTTQVLASISISGNTSVPIYTPVQIAGFVQPGLTVGMRNVGNNGGGGGANFTQCSSASFSTSSPAGNAVAALRFTENFGTAFKTRVAALSNVAGAGQMNNATGQNIPGAIYNSESGFIYSGISGFSNNPSGYAGLADYGTRLKAAFNNVPAGVSIWVSTSNIVNLTSLNGTGPVTPPNIGSGTGIGSNSTVSYAQLVLTDTSVDSNGTVPTVPATGYTVIGNSVTQVNGYAPVTLVAGSGSAVWEVVNTNPATPENFDFGVWVTYTATPGSNSPPAGTATVNMTFAPVPPSFTASAGAAFSGSLTVPRFADLSTASNLFNIVLCQTSLLFPFITNQVGFDTGIAIMNTTSDPMGTKPQAGTCALNFYGQNAPPQFVTPSIASGNPDPTKYAFQASVIAPNFEGYMIAICNFQLAHGYAFISDLGARNLAHGYLALILGSSTSTRSGNPETLTH
ncbi:MAG: hypothetical protein ABSH44_20895 [Bryobacteraceae bacterium]|jgi:hypothetical protein